MWEPPFRDRRDAAVCVASASWKDLLLREASESARLRRESAAAGGPRGTGGGDSLCSGADLNHPDRMMWIAHWYR
jgi:hypothetical protein